MAEELLAIVELDLTSSHSKTTQNANDTSEGDDARQKPSTYKGNFYNENIQTFSNEHKLKTEAGSGVGKRRILTGFEST